MVLRLLNLFMDVNYFSEASDASDLPTVEKEHPGSLTPMLGMVSIVVAFLKLCI